MASDRPKPIRTEGNRKVDRKVLEDAARIRRELEKHGITPDHGYRIAPALGGEILKPSTQVERAEQRGTSAWSVSTDEDPS